MLKLVRQALTAAVLIALAVRLRRRARLPRAEPPPSVPVPVRRARGGRAALLWLVVAAVAVVALVLALTRTTEQRDAQALARAATEQQQAAATKTEPAATARATAPATTAQATRTDAATATQATATPPNCAPSPRPIDPRRVAPEVKRAVDAQWRRIERWLRTHAPRTYRTLGAPVRARTIAVAESQTGLDFPDALRASLLRHNGSRGAGVFGFRPGARAHLTVRGMRDAWREMCARDQPGSWDGLLIPFLSYTAPDGGVAYAVVSSADGTVTGATGRRLKSSYTLLRTVADALERGGTIDGRRPAVSGGLLRWKPAG
ncbi:hypothetical protein ACFFV7_51605 [Nonomuraea spiralis]|uniref:Knr4/Smi1-like domain-containing protein n=1 Tax=Nonomuraea spiralis TaxID=46182 RepID=A0ABV5IZ04_9ACTN|nr:hypothetical protein [Nonomuraea spiralis]